jgi:hypothetical protein
MGWARHVYLMGDMRIAYKILVGKPNGKRSLGRHSIEKGVILKCVLRNQGVRIGNGV